MAGVIFLPAILIFSAPIVTEQWSTIVAFVLHVASICSRSRRRRYRSMPHRKSWQIWAILCKLLAVGILCLWVLLSLSYGENASSWESYVKNYINSTQRKSFETPFSITGFRLLGKMHVEQVGGTYIYFGFYAERWQEKRKYVAAAFVRDGMPEGYLPQWSDFRCLELCREDSI